MRENDEAQEAETHGESAAVRPADEEEAQEAELERQEETHGREGDAPDSE